MKELLAYPNITIRSAMKRLSKIGQKCLVIIDKKNLLLGTLSDGDIRKAILNGFSMNDSVENIYQKNSKFINEKDYNPLDAKKLFIENNYDLIPIINGEGKVKKILMLESILRGVDSRIKKKLNAPVVIMAGGKGTRMEPFTKILPKPLIPVHDKPIIEHIIDRFKSFGCNSFHLSVNYKSRILKAYFEELNPSHSYKFINESKPLGTAGSLKELSGKFNEPFFVTNCDIIIKADYFSLYQFHEKNSYDITLVASTKEYIIPYGTCKLNENGSLDALSEKPSFDFLINTGLYIVNPDLLDLIPPNQFYHITDLINEAKKQNMNIGVYPIDENLWIDVGQWAEYKQATENLL
tara:strand:- start:79 stop:1131 length:1053 start_codon:yes stop_codon:yes gene_type:complete